MCVTKQLLVPIDFHIRGKKTWESVGTTKCLAVNILQNI